VHSEVRKHIINDGDPIFRGYNIWRGVVETTFEIGFTSETIAKGQRVGIVPIKDGVYGWWATCNEAYMHNDMLPGRPNGRMRYGAYAIRGVCDTPLLTVRKKSFRPDVEIDIKQKKPHE
jgi:hypothetical protein